MARFLTKFFLLLILSSFLYLHAQQICRSKKDGTLRWVSGNCPKGFSRFQIPWWSMNFSGWEAPQGSVKQGSIAPGAVTRNAIAPGAVGNREIDLNLSQLMPVTYFLAAIDLDSSYTGSLPMWGYFSFEDLLTKPIIFPGNVWGCREFHLSVGLTSEPGVGNLRYFELVDSGGNSLVPLCQVTELERSCAVKNRVNYTPSNIRLNSGLLGTPYPAVAVVNIWCKP